MPIGQIEIHQHADLSVTIGSLHCGDGSVVCHGNSGAAPVDEGLQPRGEECGDKPLLPNNAGPGWVGIKGQNLLSHESSSPLMSESS